MLNQIFRSRLDFVIPKETYAHKKSDTPVMFDRAKILRMGVDVANHEAVMTRLAELVRAGSGGYVCVSNVHMCMLAFDSPSFRQVVDEASLVVADGRPIYWGQKILGAKGASQVRGQDLMESICRRSAKENLKVGLYGGASAEILARTSAQLRRKFPGVKIVYEHSPPFKPLTPEQDQQVVENIQSAEVDVLFVGIGCPKQEIWMANHKDGLDCVMLGVGAAFDFIAGSKKHAPSWLQVIGLEWLFRLGCEPRRLFVRYLKQNPRFLFYFGLQWIFGKQFK